MRLKSISYSEHDNTVSEWSITKLDLEEINLLVGKNAEGKSRTINTIAGLAKLLSGRLQIVASGNYTVKFENNDELFDYRLNIKDQCVLLENFSSPQKIYLERKGEGGVGKIFSQTEDKLIDFQTPPNQLAAATRRDEINHPFFEPLYDWGSSVYHFEFSSTLGRNSIALQTDQAPSVFDPYADTNQVIRAFGEGEKKHGPLFKKQILEDFNSIGFELEDIFLETPVIIRVQGPILGQPRCLWVREKRVKAPIEQFTLSNGMFRALSLVIQITYSILGKHPSCILIDDIAEGLDFDRSKRLIELLLKRVGNTEIQLIMASNDRLVMNNVPLEYWSLISRNGSKCQVFNYKNSKQKFDDFKFTGLNNFDFLASDFVHSDLEKHE